MRGGGPDSISCRWSNSLLQRPKEKEFEHTGFGFERVCTTLSSDYVVNPEWISEDMDRSQPFIGRRYRPWPFEFQGARYWPHVTVESREAEEQDRRRRIQSAPVYRHLEPQGVYGQDRYQLLAPVRIIAPTNTRSAWREQSAPVGGHRSPDTRIHCDINNTSNLSAPGGTGLHSYPRGTQRTAVHGNTARYSGDTMYPNTGSSMPTGLSRYTDRHVHDKFPIVLPERKSGYMNFVNCDWMP